MSFSHVHFRVFFFSFVPFFLAFVFFAVLFSLAESGEKAESSLWNGWKILFIEKSKNEDLNETEIRSILEENKIANAVFRNDGFFAPFFRDLDEKTALFFIPESESAFLSSAVLSLNEKGFVASHKIPNIVPKMLVFLPFFCALFSILVLRFRFCAFGCVFFALLSFLRPSSVLSFSCVASIFSFLCFCKNENRLFVFAIFLPAILILFFSPLDSIFFIFASILAIFVFFSSEFFFDFFAFFPLRFDFSLNFKVLKTLIFCALSIFVFSHIDLEKNPASIPSRWIPSPNSQKTGALPSVLDWEQNRFEKARAQWKNEARKYIRLGEKIPIPDFGSEIYITDYEEIDGKIVPNEKRMLVFDEQFVSSVFENENDEHDVVFLIKSQGENAEFGYSRTSQKSLRWIFALVLLIPLAALLYDKKTVLKQKFLNV